MNHSADLAAARVNSTLEEKFLEVAIQEEFMNESPEQSDALAQAGAIAQLTSLSNFLKPRKFLLVKHCAGVKENLSPNLIQEPLPVMRLPLPTE